MMLPLPSLEELRDAFVLDASTGLLYWRERQSQPLRINAAWTGKQAGSLTRAGYIRVAVNGRRFLAHRIVWKLFYGSDPPEFIDHINGDGADNRPANLRAATHPENMWNRGRTKDKELPKGVFRAGIGYVAQIKANGTLHRLGRFDDVAAASAAYERAATELHGQFSRKAG